MASASDALATLKRAVGSASACDEKPCVCDVNSDGAVTSSDALRVLRVAVGQQVQLACDCPCGGEPACNGAPVDGDEEFTWSEDVTDTGSFLISLLENATDPDTDSLHIPSLDNTTLTFVSNYRDFVLDVDGFAGQLSSINQGEQTVPLLFEIEPATGVADFTLSPLLFWYGLRTGEWVELGLDYTVSDGFATDFSTLTIRIEGKDSPPDVQSSFYSFTSSQVNDGLAKLEPADLAQNFFDPDFDDQVAFLSFLSVEMWEDVPGPALGVVQVDASKFEILDGTEVVALLLHEPEVGVAIESVDSDFWSNLGADQSVAFDVLFLVHDQAGLEEEGVMRFRINGVASSSLRLQPGGN